MTFVLESLNIVQHRCMGYTMSLTDGMSSESLVLVRHGPC